MSIWFVRITTHSGILHCGRVDDPPLRWGRTFLVCSYNHTRRHPALREGQDPPLRQHRTFMEPPIMRKNSRSAVGAVINRLRHHTASPENPPANPHPLPSPGERVPCPNAVRIQQGGRGMREVTLRLRKCCSPILGNHRQRVGGVRRKPYGCINQSWKMPVTFPCSLHFRPHSCGRPGLPGICTFRGIGRTKKHGNIGKNVAKTAGIQEAGKGKNGENVRPERTIFPIPWSICTVLPEKPGGFRPSKVKIHKLSINVLLDLQNGKR